MRLDSHVNTSFSTLKISLTKNNNTWLWNTWHVHVGLRIFDLAVTKTGKALLHFCHCLLERGVVRGRKKIVFRVIKYFQDLLFLWHGHVQHL